MLTIIKLRLLRLKDEVAVFVLMTAMALGFTAIFGASFSDYKPTVLIVDEDKSSYSETLITELKLNKGFIFIETNLNNAEVEVEEGRASIAFLINEGFQESMEKGKGIDFGILKIKDDTIILSLQELVSSITLKIASGFKIASVSASFVQQNYPSINFEQVKDSAYKNVIESWKFKNPMKITVSDATTGMISDDYDGLMHSMIGFTLFFSMYTMVFAIGTILYDKQYKTWDRMLISPVSKASILGGSMIVAYITGAVQMGVLILSGKYLLGVNWGNSILGILIVSAAFVFAVTSLGLMLSGIIKTQAQLSSLTPILLTSTSMIGGCMWPLEIVNNKALLFLAELTPQKWAMQGLEGIASKGMGLEAAIIPAIVLMVMGFIFFSVGVITLKN